MTAWRKLLGKRESIVLPYFGGRTVRLRDREVRLSERPEKVGWYRFEVEGRTARAGEAAEGDLSPLPVVRGHVVGDRLFGSSSVAERIAIMPDDEPPLFAPCTCRRWWSDDLVFDTLELESEIEETVRGAFAERRSLEWVNGVPAPLRAAFAWAVARRAGQERGIACSPREIAPYALEIAEGGPPAAETVLDRLEDLRHGRRLQIGGHTLRVRKILTEAEAMRPDATRENAEERVITALEAAGAHFYTLRRLAGGAQLEVSFEFRGERFITVVHTLSLQVIDAGICLVDHADGGRADEELTLESLPSVIKEAMDSGLLVITRRA